MLVYLRSPLESTPPWRTCQKCGAAAGGACEFPVAGRRGVKAEAVGGADPLLAASDSSPPKPLATDPSATRQQESRAIAELPRHDTTIARAPLTVTLALPLPLPVSSYAPARVALPRPFTPDPHVVVLLRIALLAAARLRPSSSRLAGSPRFTWRVEEGGSSATWWTPLPRKPRRRVTAAMGISP